MTTIYLIRHSKSIGINNVKYETILEDQIKNERLPLSPDGEELAKKISEYDELKDIDVIYSSEYERAISTAKYISDKNELLLHITNKLNERKMGDTKDIPKFFWSTQFEDENAKANGGESRKEVTKRMYDFLESILKEYKNKRIVLVTHATAISFLLMKWCELVDIDIDNKSRQLNFKGKEVINGCRILSKAFSASIEIIMWFLSFNLLMWCFTLIDL